MLSLPRSPIEASEDRELSSWFYSIRSYIVDQNDSTWYKYDSKGRLTEYRWYSELNGKNKSTYTYDANGRCTKEQNFRNGKLSSTENFVYDKSGRLVSSNVISEQVKTSWSTYTYDSAGRERRRILFTQQPNKVVSDTFLTEYGVNTIQKSGKIYSGTEKNITEFTEYDSVAAYYSSRTYKGSRPTIDSTVFLRDSLTHQKLLSTRKTSYGTVTVQWQYENGKVTSVTSRFNDKVTQIVFYDTSGHPIRDEYYYKEKLFSITTWSYSPDGDVLEERLTTPEGKLVQREIYEYSYY